MSGPLPTIKQATVSQPQLHVFVCQNDRPAGGKPSCGATGGTVFAALQREIGADPVLWGRVAITSSGCLGRCFEGPTVVVYPDAVWYGGITAEDVPEIVERHLRRGEAVERLRLQET